MDEVIAQRAANERQMLAMQLQWLFDYYRCLDGRAVIVESGTKGSRHFMCWASCAPYAHMHWCIDKEGNK